ncbi:hypothetical protein MTR_8g028525 [Medicago truncatula]|uniref:Uncharacterized protein n=1 Tax=Medicago truncatula TaxID=3880 RepID=A0A072TN04_MEDTR|nr:hypothetical protein MTR_8g028525 [Medicago truncatula]
MHMKRIVNLRIQHDLSKDFRLINATDAAVIAAAMINELATGDSAASYPFLGGLFFLQLDTQNIILIHNQEKYAVMRSIGMFQKWLCSSKF